jgi:hypothetical protein
MCNGVNAKGEQCKRKAEWCYQHIKQKPQTKTTERFWDFIHKTETRSYCALESYSAYKRFCSRNKLSIIPEYSFYYQTRQLTGIVSHLDLRWWRFI